MSLLPRNVPDASEFVLDEKGLEVALDRVLQSAKKLTGARYAALCVLNDARDGLAVFITAGIDDGTRAKIGKWPCGRGVLGDLILVRDRARSTANQRRHFLNRPGKASCAGLSAPVSPFAVGSSRVVDRAATGPLGARRSTAGRRPGRA